MTWVILDRDGVINQDSDDYIKSVAEWQPIPGSLEAIAHLNHLGYRVAIATNQSGVGRGFLTLGTLHAMHVHMMELLDKVGGHLDYIAYCPHHPEENCDCRKPKIGLLLEISAALHLSLDEAVFVGDTLKDLQTADQAGCRGVLVRTGKGQRTLDQFPALLHHYAVYNNLEEFVQAL